MPTGTFFRLPKEKRQRLIDAAWEEFTQVRFTEASINKIIKGAHIPRGSFYQYFEDKEDLFRYLQGEMREYFAGLMSDLLSNAKGDPFVIPLAAFDRFVSQSGDTDPVLLRFIQVMQRNRWLDSQWLVPTHPHFPPECLLGHVDTSRLRFDTQDFLEHVFFLLIASLAYAVMETLRAPESWEQQRERLRQHVAIIQCGSVATSSEEYAAASQILQGGKLC